MEVEVGEVDQAREGRDVARDVACRSRQKNSGWLSAPSRTSDHCNGEAGEFSKGREDLDAACGVSTLLSRA